MNEISKAMQTEHTTHNIAHIIVQITKGRQIGLYYMDSIGILN